MQEASVPVPGSESVVARERVQLCGVEEQLFHTHNETLVRITTRAASGSRAVAEDACQFAWLQLLRDRPKHDQPFAWLIVVARHRAWQLMRQARREIPSDGPVGADGSEAAQSLGERVADPVTLGLRLEAREALRAVACLPERQRRPLALKLAGYSYQEICGLTGRSYTHVNRHLVRARRSLRDAA